MKKYKKVEMVAMNAPCGSYVAGCPPEKSAAEWGKPKSYDFLCKQCERSV